MNDTIKDAPSDSAQWTEASGEREAFDLLNKAIRDCSGMHLDRMEDDGSMMFRVDTLKEIGKELIRVARATPSPLRKEDGRDEVMKELVAALKDARAFMDDCGNPDCDDTNAAIEELKARSDSVIAKAEAARG